MSKRKILLVEDDDSLGFVVKDSLELEGFEVHWSQNGDLGFEAFKESAFDVIILDVMMPKKDGFTLAKEIRVKDDYTPIIFLTAKTMEEDRLLGFEIGADDYVVKPFSIKELVYRIQRLIKRGEHIKPEGDQLKIGSYQFDLKNQQLVIAGEIISLTYMEAQLVDILSKNVNSSVKREDILVSIWGENDYFKGRSLDVFISRLRKYFSRDSTIEIKNIHGVGFMMKC